MRRVDIPAGTFAIFPDPKARQIRRLDGVQVLEASALLYRNYSYYLSSSRDCGVLRDLP